MIYWNNNLTHKPLTKIKVIIKHFRIQLEVVFSSLGVV